MIGKILLLGLVIAQIWSSRSDNFYTSEYRLQHLFNFESEVLNIIQNYRSVCYRQIEELENLVKQLENEHSIAANVYGYEAYLNNPINSYLLLKRLSMDWTRIHDHIANPTDVQKVVKDVEKLYKDFEYPTNSDLSGAALGIDKLRRTYQLNISDITNGVLNGIQYGAIMNWKDCLEIGLQLYDKDYFESAVLWLEEAMRLQKLSNAEVGVDLSDINILELISNAYEELGNLNKALNVTTEILSIEWSNSVALAKKDVLKSKIFFDNQQTEGDPINQFQSADLPEEDIFLFSEKICHQSVTRNTLKLPQLHCRYIINIGHYHTISSFKFEEVSLDPFVGVYHDVLSANDAEILKNLAKPKLFENLILGEEDPKNDKYRTSQGSGFDYSDQPVLMKIYRLVEDISGLDMKTAEPILISNYGIGGSYGPHCDFLQNDKNSINLDEFGDRIATAMIYLSNVEQGGATAFVNLETVTLPKLGSLVFWYNLKSSGAPDYLTYHAACPVIKGSKWIANIWIRSQGQEFRRPCTIKSEE